MIHRYGDRALLLDCPDPLALAAPVRRWAGVVDAVPGDGSLLVTAADGSALDELAHRLRSVEPEPAPEAAAVELPVVYDGPDLDDVARACGLTTGEVVAAHLGGEYVVALVGFVPGFGYLRGLDGRLAVPRRAEPRPVVPAGSVAVAGGWTGVYPRQTPGGWHLIGRTTAVLWDLAHDPPALLQPGARVRFVA